MHAIGIGSVASRKSLLTPNVWMVASSSVPFVTDNDTLKPSRSASRLSNLSNSSNHMDGTTLDRYRNTLGQNLKRKSVLSKRLYTFVYDSFWFVLFLFLFLTRFDFLEGPFHLETNVRLLLRHTQHFVQRIKKRETSLETADGVAMMQRECDSSFDWATFLRQRFNQGMPK